MRIKMVECSMVLRGLATLVGLYVVLGHETKRILLVHSDSW